MSKIATACELMTRFAERTGLTGEREPRRYLWTDAFAVCNFLGLGRSTGESRYRDLALRLIDQVHRTLGRHRGDDGRRGWLSGLDEEEGAAHPTRGGLRIGKPFPERAPTEAPDEAREWDRDGQYFHYLTKWMYALDETARVTANPVLNRWARELAVTAHRAFTYSARGGRKRMYWKASIDLSRPIVASMGQHDALDGFVTCAELDSTSRSLRMQPLDPPLEEASRDFAAMIDVRSLATADPLGIGGLLADALRLERLMREQALPPHRQLRAASLNAAFAGLHHYLRSHELDAAADRRLAFRELGLAIGLAAAERLDRPLRDELAADLPLRAVIESFWLSPEHRQGPTWLAHEDINDVMLATSLAPDGFLSEPAKRDDSQEAR